MGQSPSSRTKHYKNRLVKAVRNGDLKQLQRLLAKGQVNVNQVTDHRGCPLLCLAVRKNDLELVNAILEEGCKPGMDNGHHKNWQVHIASPSSDTVLTRLYLNLGDPTSIVCETIIMDDDCLGAEFYTNHKKARYYEAGNVDVDVTDKKGLSAVHITAINGATDIAKILIEKRADVNKVDTLKASPLHAAAAYGHENMCELLLKNGAHVNLMEKSGLTPLHLAVMTGGTEVIRTLLHHGAWAGVADNEGRSPMHFAAVLSSFRGLDDVVRTNRSLLINLLLLKYGGAITYQDESKCSPMSYALIKSNIRLVRMYLDCGIRLEKEDYERLQERHPKVIGTYDDELDYPDVKVPSLLRCCRSTVMSYIAEMPSSHSDSKLYTIVNNLEIPTTLKDFLKYKW